MLGLPTFIKACLFDMDGVLTRTATLHARAWQRMFDAYLSGRAGPQEPFVPFNVEKDYLLYVDGKARADGVRAFLRSRGIELPEGTPEDSPGSETIHGLGTLKNEMVRQLMDEVGVEAFEGSRRYVTAVREQGLRTGVVSASASTLDVLEASGMKDMFDTVVDGNVAIHQGLKGKPAPDGFLFGADNLGVMPAESAVFEDALAGVEAGHAGGFGFVVGVDRLNQGPALLSAGADVVVRDLAELLNHLEK